MLYERNQLSFHQKSETLLLKHFHNIFVWKGFTKKHNFVILGKLSKWWIILTLGKFRWTFQTSDCWLKVQKFSPDQWLVSDPSIEPRKMHLESRWILYLLSLVCLWCQYQHLPQFESHWEGQILNNPKIQLNQYQIFRSVKYLWNANWVSLGTNSWLTVSNKSFVR